MTCSSGHIGIGHWCSLLPCGPVTRKNPRVSQEETKNALLPRTNTHQVQVQVNGEQLQVVDSSTFHAETQKLSQNISVFCVALKSQNNDWPSNSERMP